MKKHDEINEAWESRINDLLDGELNAEEAADLRAEAENDAALAQAIIDAYALQASLDELEIERAPASLRKRLADLGGDASFAERTQAVLMEALPSGQLAMESVARRLAVSSRTFQRRLSDEGTSFKQVIGITREKLARHYLHRTQLSSTEIAYLLGFEEPNSFFRAFHHWTGDSPERVRKAATLH